MIPCPCCSQQMLMYAQKGRAYWYCPHCRQEMPDLLSVLMTKYHQRLQGESLHKTLTNNTLTNTTEPVAT